MQRHGSFEQQIEITHDDGLGLREPAHHIGQNVDKTFEGAGAFVVEGATRKAETCHDLFMGAAFEVAFKNDPALTLGMMRGARRQPIERFAKRRYDDLANVCPVPGKHYNQGVGAKFGRIIEIAEKAANFLRHTIESPECGVASFRCKRVIRLPAP
jgi:hypothetical protein